MHNSSLARLLRSFNFSLAPDNGFKEEKYRKMERQILSKQVLRFSLYPIG
jgi:hypothetical protein